LYAIESLSERAGTMMLAIVIALTVILVGADLAEVPKKLRELAR
jgi:hypothetical protein